MKNLKLLMLLIGLLVFTTSCTDLDEDDLITNDTKIENTVNTNTPEHDIDTGDGDGSDSDKDG